MTNEDTKIEQIPNPKVDTPEVVPNTESADVSLDLEDFKKKTLMEIEWLKDIADDTKREQKRLDILNTLATKELELKSLKETVGFKKELADLFASTIDELKKKVEEDREWFFGKAVDKVKEGANWTLDQGKKVFDGKEWKEHTAQNVARVAVGAGLLYGGYRLFKSIFGSKEDTKETSKDASGTKEKKWFWDTWYGKAVKYGSIAGGAFYVLRWLFTGKRDVFGIGKDKDAPENPGNGWLNLPWQTPENADKLAEQPEAVKDAYNSVWNSINEFYDVIYDGNSSKGDEYLWASDFEQDTKGNIYPGLAPFILDARYDSVDAMLSENAFFYEVYGSQWVALFDVLKKKGLDKVKSLILPLFKWLDGVANKVYIDLLAAKTADDFFEKLKWAPNAEHIIRSAFRKDIKVLAYLENRKHALEYYLAKKHLETTNEDDFTTKSSEDQDDMIYDKIADDIFYANNIKITLDNEFLKQHLLTKDGTWWALKTLGKYGLMNAVLTPDDQKKIDDINEDKSDILDGDATTNTLTKLQNKLATGSLDAKDTKKLSELTDDMYSHMTNVGNKNWVKSYLPILELFPTEDDTFDKMLEGTGYNQIVADYKKQMDVILQKAKNNTITSADIAELSTLVDDYFIMQKEVSLGSGYIYDVREENGSTIVRYGYTFIKSGEQLFHGVQMIVDGHRAKWWLMVAGSVVSLDLISWPVRSVFGMKFASSPTASGIMRLWSFVTKKAFNFTGMQLKSSIASVSPGLASHFYGSEQALYDDIIRGKIGLNDAANVANWKKFKYGNWAGKTIVKSVDDLLMNMFPDKTTQEYNYIKEALTKYAGNKNIMKKIFNQDYAWQWYKPSDWLKLDKTKLSWNLDVEYLKKLHDITVRVDQLPNNVNKQILQSMLKYTDDIDRATDLAIIGVDPKYFSYFENGANKIISADKFGKFLGQYVHKMDAFDMDVFMQFVDDAKKAGKIQQVESFMKNSLKNWDAIKWLTNKLDAVDDMKLNVGFVEKVGNSFSAWWKQTQDVFTKWMDAMKKALAGTKDATTLAEGNAVLQDAQTIQKDLNKVTENTVNQANKWGKLFGKLDYLNTISENGVTQINAIKLAMQDKVFADALSKAATLDDVKALLTTKWLNIAEVPVEVLEKLSKTKKVSAISEYLWYAAEYKNMNTLMKVFRNPLFKKCLNRWWVWVTAVLSVVQYLWDTKEAAEIAKINLDRSKVKQNQATFNLAVGWWLSLAFATGLAMWWNPGGWVILWIAGTIEWIKAAGDAYYEVVDSYYRNVEDFKRMYVSHIKQEIISKSAWQEKVDISFQENFQETVAIMFGNLYGDEKHARAISTVDEAVRALIYLEEIEKYPYATIDSNKIDDQPKELQDMVVKQRKALALSCQIRFDYIKANYKNSLIPKDKIASAQWLSVIDDILLESRKYLTMKKESLITTKDDLEITEKDLYYDNETKKTIDWYQKTLYDKLSQNSSFAVLEKLYPNNTQEFTRIMYSIQYFASYMQQQWNTDPILQANIQYFIDYFQYKNYGKLPSELPRVEVDPQSIDYTMLTTFFTDFTLQRTWYTKDAIVSAVQSGSVNFLDSTEVESKLSVSPILGQNILYRIATEVLKWYKWSNTLDDLKSFYNPDQREKTWIYYEDGNWYINHSFNGIQIFMGKDKFIGTDADLNKPSTMKIMKDDIFSAAHLNKKYNYDNPQMSDDSYYSLIDADAETDETNINRDYGTKMLSIIDQEVKYRDAVNVALVKKTAVDYIQQNSKWNYIALPLDILSSLTRAWFANIGQFYYKYENGSLTAITTPTNKDVVCALTTSVEYTANQIEKPSEDINKYISLVDTAQKRLQNLVAMEDGDLDIDAYSAPDLLTLLNTQYTKWQAYKKKVSLLSSAQAVNDMKTNYMNYLHTFNTMYTMILSASTSGSDNDVDSYDDYVAIKNVMWWPLVTAEKVDNFRMLDLKPNDLLDEQYKKYFNRHKNTLKIATRNNKTLDELINSKDKADQQYALCAADIMIRSMAEAAMVDKDTQEIYNAWDRDINDKAFVRYFAENLKTITPELIASYSL